jgi:hypothetical protein
MLPFQQFCHLLPKNITGYISDSGRKSENSLQSVERLHIHAYLVGVEVEELLHYLLAQQLSWEEVDQQQSLSSGEGGLLHLLLMATDQEPRGWEMESQGLHTLASCLREKGLAGYLVLDWVLQ